MEAKLKSENSTQRYMMVFGMSMSICVLRWRVEKHFHNVMLNGMVME